MEGIQCPVCRSHNVRPAERDFKNEYSFLTVLAAVFFLLLLLFLLFFIVQLHPVIIVLLGIALVTKLLEWLRKPAEKTESPKEWMCMRCKNRFAWGEAEEKKSHKQR